MIKILIPIFLLLLVVNNCLLAQNVNDSLDNTDYGKLVISTNLEEFYVVIDHDIKGFQKISSGDTLELKKGIHSITLVWETIRDYEFSIFINPNEVAEKNLTIYQFSNAISNSFQLLENRENVSISTDKNSEIFIDGESIGTEQATLFLNPGKYDLFISNPDHGSLNKTLRVDYLEYSMLARYNQHPNPIPSYAKLIPGLSYLSSRQTKKAALTYSTLTLFAGAIISNNRQYKEKRELFDVQNKAYLETVSGQEATLRYNEAQNTLDEMESINLKRNFLFISASILYAITTIDAFKKPKEGYSYSNKLTPQISVLRKDGNGAYIMGIGFKKGF